MRLESVLLLCAAIVGISALVGTTAAPTALIDTRQYAVCKLIGANSTGDIIEGGFGTLTKPEKITEKNVTYECVGLGIKNDSGKNQTFAKFNCTVILSDGVQRSTQNTSAQLSYDGKEYLQCTFDVASKGQVAAAPVTPVVQQVAAPAGGQVVSQVPADSQIVQQPPVVNQNVQQSPSGTAVEGQVVVQPQGR